MPNSGRSVNDVIDKFPNRRRQRMYLIKSLDARAFPQSLL